MNVWSSWRVNMFDIVPEDRDDEVMLTLPMPEDDVPDLLTILYCSN